MTLLTASAEGVLFSRMLTTALIVIVITLAVDRLGALAGLPTVIGPGLLFLTAENGAVFAAEAAAFALISLCATEGLLLAYCLAAASLGATASLRWRAPRGRDAPS